eukprot:tig00000704_g3303.t1
MRCRTRRWRRVIEETEWPSVELRVKGGKPTDWTSSGVVIKRSKQPRTAGAGGAGPRHEYSLLSALFEEGRLRLGGSAGCSFALRAELPQVGAEDSNAAVLTESHQLAAFAACELLGAVASSLSDPTQLREVSVEFSRAPGSSSSSRVANAYRLATEDLLRSSLLGVLRALRPPAGAPASRLEGLSVVFRGRWRGDAAGPRQAWPRAAELRAALAPFGRLRSLTLSFARADAGADGAAAAAIAAACPLLRSLALGPSEAAALAALAPLAHLERLAVAWPPPAAGGSCPTDASAGLVPLAYGPAGRSLRAVAFVDDPTSDPFLEPEGARSARVAATQPSLAALARMPNLESVVPLQIDAGGLKPEGVLALGRLAGLREARLSLCGVANSAALRALAEALSCLPRLERLGLELALGGYSSRTGGVAALLKSAGARRALADLHLAAERPLEEAEAEAIAALPALRRLRLSSRIDAPPSLRPFEALRALRPEVAVRVELHRGDIDERSFAGARAAVERMLAVRRPVRHPALGSGLSAQAPAAGSAAPFPSPSAASPQPSNPAWS